MCILFGCFNGAAILRPRKRIRRQPGLRNQPGLQWSRDPKTAETSDSAGEKTRYQYSFNGAAILRPRKPFRPVTWLAQLKSFNGAAILRPRKLGTAAAVFVLLPLLQWSRDPKTAET